MTRRLLFLLGLMIAQPATAVIRDRIPGNPWPNGVG